MATTEQMFSAHSSWCKSEALQYEAKAKEALEEYHPETGKNWHDKWMDTARRYHDNAAFYEERALMFAQETKAEAKLIELV